MSREIDKVLQFFSACRILTGMSESKRGPGRPATGKTPQISVALHPDIRVEVQAAARADGCSVATVVRRAIRAYLESVKVKS